MAKCAKKCFAKNIVVFFLHNLLGAFCLGLKRRCIFQFSRKCENHAKMGRFLRNFSRKCENENFRFNPSFVINVNLEL
jgi:hypothetical protein